MVHLHNGILCSKKKEGAPTLHDSMDGSGEHHAKWNKPGGRRQMPYDLAYEWNLINKTNKQAKYNQRRRNKEQTDSNQREGGRGIMREIGEGLARNMYKECMDKAKGEKDWGWEVEVSGTGESGGREIDTTVLEQ